MDELRRQLIITAQRMDAAGLNKGTAGNVSVRTGQGRVTGFLITPTGMPYDALASEDIVFMHLDGRCEGRRKPSSEWRFHRCLLYTSRCV